MERSFKSSSLTKVQEPFATIRPGLTKAAISQSDRDRRTRALATVARARISNVWLRLSACVVAAMVTMSIVGSPASLFWLAGVVVVLLYDRRVFQRLLRLCVEGAAPQRIRYIVLWTGGQSI